MRLNKLLALATALSFAYQALAQQVINVGVAANDGTGDPIRTAFQKTNANFAADFVTLQPALTGIVTTAGNSNVTSVTSGSLTNSMLAPMNASSVKCNNSASPGAASDCTVATLLTLLTSTSGGGTTNFLRADGAWAAPAGGGGGGGIGSIGLTMPGVFTVTGSPLTANGAIAVSANGISGGVPYFNTATTMASSAALSANQLLLGDASPSGRAPTQKE